jgi:hypothetical protein
MSDVMTGSRSMQTAVNRRMGLFGWLFFGLGDETFLLALLGVLDARLFKIAVVESENLLIKIILRVRKSNELHKLCYNFFL